MPTPFPIYERATEDGALRQGEIVSNLVEALIDLDKLNAEVPSFLENTHPYAVIVSQDCDLEWDWIARDRNKMPGKRMVGILFCVAEPSSVAVQRLNYKQHDYVKTNREERFQLLQRVEAESDLLGVGVPELIVDFKRYFSLPADEVYERLKIGELERRCRLNGPYLQHFTNRFCFFQNRVALPVPHYSEPVEEWS